MHDQPQVRSDFGRSDAAAPGSDAVRLEQRIGLLLRELAHEFGNLIFPLQMIMELQERSGGLTPEELSDILHAHIAELLTITKRFQRIGRCMSDRMEPTMGDVRPVDIVHAAVEAVRPMLSACRLSLSLELASAPETIEGDPDLLQHAVGELLDNAVRFTPSGGVITVAVRASGEEVEFVVADNGPGIAAELQSLVFEPFVHGGARLDIGAGRFGCGLTLARRIAAAHHGTAELRRSTGEGSEFFMSLPRRQPD